MKSRLIKDTTREEREEIVRKGLWSGCGAECEFCSGCDNRGDGRIDSLYQSYIGGEKDIAKINAEYRPPTDYFEADDGQRSLQSVEKLHFSTDWTAAAGCSAGASPPGPAYKP